MWTWALLSGGAINHHPSPASGHSISGFASGSWDPPAGFAVGEGTVAGSEGGAVPEASFAGGFSWAYRCGPAGIANATSRTAVQRAACPPVPQSCPLYPEKCLCMGSRKRWSDAGRRRTGTMKPGSARLSWAAGPKRSISKVADPAWLRTGFAGRTPAGHRGPGGIDVEGGPDTMNRQSWAGRCSDSPTFHLDSRARPDSPRGSRIVQPQPQWSL